MVNKVLFKANLKSNYGIIIFILLMLLMYTTIAVGMYDPDSAKGMAEMMDMLPESMVKAFGFDGLGSEITSYIGNYLYGFIYLMFPVIFIVILANSLMVKHVESGSMTYLLTTPNTRKKIARTQGTFLASSLFILMFINVIVGILMAQLMFPDMLKINSYIALNGATFGCLYMVSSISFYISSTFNDSKKALSISAGIPIVFIVVKMVSSIADQVEFLNYLSLFSFIDINKIIETPSYGYLVFIGTFLMGSLIYYLSVVAFDKRSLSI